MLLKSTASYFIILLFGVSLFIGCRENLNLIDDSSQNQTAPQVQNLYSGYDSNRALVIKGWIHFSSTVPNNTKGTWRLNAVVLRIDVGPQIGSGEFSGSTGIDGVTVLNLNPSVNDQNVYLSGVLDNSRFNRVWIFSDYAGIKSRWTFEAAKPTGGRFDGNGIIFSGGFYLSGYTDSVLWANAVASADRIADYLPGKVGSNPSDPKNKLYIINRNDSPFGISWQEWQAAVSQGAYFYDGNGNGIYNPMDKNSNGQWDPNEDMPDILGDETVWCVYNDAVIDTHRRYKVQPQGIEVRQTVFASNRIPNLNNVIFIRYSFKNSGTKFSTLGSVYFGLWPDIDLGNYTDDLAGCDTTLSTAYVYNDSSDFDFGTNPPAIFLDIVHGPKVYTGNILDTAINMKGKLPLSKI